MLRKLQFKMLRKIQFFREIVAQNTETFVAQNTDFPEIVVQNTGLDVAFTLRKLQMLRKIQ